jgi:hypothetical protein
MERLRRTRARLEARLPGLPDDTALRAHLERLSPTTLHTLLVSGAWDSAGAGGEEVDVDWLLAPLPEPVGVPRLPSAVLRPSSAGHGDEGERLSRATSAGPASASPIAAAGSLTSSRPGRPARDGAERGRPAVARALRARIPGHLSLPGPPARPRRTPRARLSAR